MLAVNSRRECLSAAWVVLGLTPGTRTAEAADAQFGRRVLGRRCSMAMRDVLRVPAAQVDGDITTSEAPGQPAPTARGNI